MRRPGKIHPPLTPVGQTHLMAPQAKMFRAGLYARVSTNDQQTPTTQSRAIREYAARRGWTIAVQVREVGSGAAKRETRERLLEAHAVERSTSCSYGDLTAGAGR